MKIGILGSGTVGSNMGRAWAASGHQVMFGSREPGGAKMRALLGEIGAGAAAGTAAEAVAFGDVIAIALPWTALPDVLASAGDWSGKIVIDATNRFSDPPAGSASLTEDIARQTGAHVVKALNTIGAEHYVDPTFSGQPATAFICGDDDGAKAAVASLVTDMGFEVIDIGPLSNAALLDNLARLWVALARSGFGRDFAFRILTK
jgi:hypothetical protein